MRKNQISDRKRKFKYNQTSSPKSFSRFKLYIEYEGTRYSGWQKQENAKTIQGTIIQSAKKIFGKSEILFHKQKIL